MNLRYFDPKNGDEGILLCGGDFGAKYNYLTPIRDFGPKLAGGGGGLLCSGHLLSILGTCRVRE